MGRACEGRRGETAGRRGSTSVPRSVAKRKTRRRAKGSASLVCLSRSKVMAGRNSAAIGLAEAERRSGLGQNVYAVTSEEIKEGQKKVGVYGKVVEATKKADRPALTGPVDKHDQLVLAVARHAPIDGRQYALPYKVV